MKREQLRLGYTTHCYYILIKRAQCQLEYNFLTYQKTHLSSVEYFRKQLIHSRARHQEHVESLHVTCYNKKNCSLTFAHKKSTKQQQTLLSAEMSKIKYLQEDPEELFEKLEVLGEGYVYHVLCFCCFVDNPRFSLMIIVPMVLYIRQ